MRSLITRLSSRHPGNARLYIPSWLLWGITYAMFSMGVALLLAQDYGQGWDDAAEAFYGRVVSRAFSGSSEYYEYAFQSYFGPGYQLLQYLGTSLLSNALHSWNPVHLRYFLNYLVFQIGVVAIFSIARRWFSRFVSALIALLFLTQPVLFGHAFINHKDGVFTSLFAASVASGLVFVDLLVRYFSQGNKRRTHLSRARTVVISMLLAFLILLLLDAAIFHYLSALMARITIAAYHGKAIGPISILFSAVAENRTSIGAGAYAYKAAILASRFELASATIISFITTLLLVRSILQPGRRSFLALIGALVLSSVLLGLTTSVRIAGPFAGLLVLIYAIFNLHRLRPLSFIAFYLLFAYAVTFLTWPAMWQSPLGHPIEALRIFANFPPHDVLFQGNVFSSLDLPASFLPTLLLMQITEPALALCFVGIALIAVRCVQGKLKVTPDVSIIILWFLVPFLAVILFRLPNYGGFRHYLFILPPTFLACGVSLSAITRMIRDWKLITVISVVAILPGIISIFYLHPYEYVYFNTASGGLGAAYGRFDLDYWCISYAQAMRYLNRVAPQDSDVIVWGPTQVAQTFARPDLNIQGEGEISGSPEYAMACSSALLNPNFYSTFRTTFDVEVGGVILARIKANPLEQP